MIRHMFVLFAGVMLVGTGPGGARSGDVFQDCPECPEMVIVPAGEFTMGAPASGDGRRNPQNPPNLEGPPHIVTIPASFAVGMYEVTRGAFAAFVRESGQVVAAESCDSGVAGHATSWHDPGYPQTDRDPVVCVSWGDAWAYAAWLGRTTGRPYRLLTEAEWEYAARGGTATARYWDGGADAACGYANVHDATSLRLNGFDWQAHVCDDGAAHTVPVGSYAANPFGLHDMLGNVAEWVEDCRHDGYEGAPADGSAWRGGDECGHRMIRGGSWASGPSYVYAASRNWEVISIGNAGLGFRVARDL